MSNEKKDTEKKLSERVLIDLMDKMVDADEEFLKFTRKNKPVIKMMILYLLSLTEGSISLSKLIALLYFSYRVGILDAFNKKRCKKLLKKLRSKKK